MKPSTSQRKIRSYVLRAGRMTASQKRALDELWPNYGIEYSESELDLDVVFSRHASRVLEIGFGNGETLIESAIQHREIDFLGIEVHQPGVGRLLSGIRKYELENIRVSCHDAVEVLQHQITDNSLGRVQILFPDPWPKKRHHKRRIVNPEFVRLLGKKLKTGGRLHLATDWQNYAEQMLDTMEQSPLYKNTAGTGFAERPETRPLTKFEQRGQRLGHGVWDLIYARNDVCAE